MRQAEAVLVTGAARRIGRAIVERLARDKLHMRTATPAITQYVTDDGSPVVSAAAAGGRP